MSNLQKESFRIIKQKPIMEQYYSYFLNELLSIKQENKVTTDTLAFAFKCSKGTISNFETRIKKYDFEMLFNYANLFGYKIEMFLVKKEYSEKFT